MGGLEILLGDLIITYKHVMLSYPCKFRSGYLYFPNNLKDVKDHIQADMISSKMFFQLMVTVFKEKLKYSGQVVLLERSQFVSQKLGMNFQKWEKI